MTTKANLPKLYTERRRTLMSQMVDDIGLIDGSGLAPDPLLYDKNLQYLTGLRSKDAILVLAPQGIRIDRFETLQGPEIGRGRTVNEVLFVRELTEREKLIDGEGTGYDKIAAFRNQLTNFSRAITSREKLLIDAADTMASVEVIEAAYSSMRESHWTPVRNGSPTPG